MLLSFIANSYAAKVSVIVNKLLLLLIVDVSTTNDEQQRRTMCLRIFAAETSSHVKYFLNVLFILSYHFVFSFHSSSRSQLFLGMIAPDSRSRNVGLDFFIPSHSFTIPNFGNAFFSFPSLSQNLGMDFFSSLPVPEFLELSFSIPFPFPKFGNGIIHSHS